MIQTNYNAIPNKLFLNYLNFLVGKLYKILPMFENKDKTLIKYLKNLQIELTGNLDLIEELKYDGNLQTILNNVEYIIQNNVTRKECKNIVFNSINIVKKIQNEYR